MIERLIIFVLVVIALTAALDPFGWIKRCRWQRMWDERDREDLRA